MRVLHFSDPHVSPRLLRVPLGDWPNKRITGAVGEVLIRRRRFAAVRERLARLAEFALEQAVDLVLCTGDHTVLGTDGELAEAREALQPFVDAPLGLVTIPGNHDLYTGDTVREGRFDRHFGDTLPTELAHYAVDGPWPLVRRVSDEVAVIALNSAEPRWAPWRSGGRIPDAQLDALQSLLAESWTRERFVFVMTHHAPRLATGRPDRFNHRLDNHAEFLAVCSGVERGAVLFGHVHHCYRLVVPGLRATLFGAGSVSMLGREGLWLFDVDGDRARATRGRWSDGRYVLDERECYDC